MSRGFALAVAALFAGLVMVLGVAPAAAAPAAPAVPAVPAAPTPPVGPASATTAPGSATVGVQINGPNGKPSSSIVILLLMTVLSVAPALLLLCTSFTKIFVVLSIVRNALGLTSVPPNQVIAGLALFLSLFIMGPTVSEMNKQGVQPYLKGEKTQTVAFHDGVEPLRKFMLKHTREDEIALLTKVAGKPLPKNVDDVDL